MNSLIDTDQSDQPQIDENQDFLAILTGPGGKYDRTKYADEKEMWQAIAKGKVLADSTLNISNKRMDELREDYKKLREEHMTGQSMKEYLDQLKALNQPNSRDQNPPANEDKRPVFDPTEIESLVSKKIQEDKIISRQQANFNEVRSKLTERFGPNHADILKKQIDELGLTVEEADRMARNAPKAFYRTFGLDQNPPSDSFEAPPRSMQRSDGFAPNVPKRDYEFYKKMRKEDPTRYYDPKTQVQMHEDAQRMGEAFGA